MPQALIFGINGQDGFYLDKLLREKNIDVTAVSRSCGSWISGNIADQEFTASLIRTLKPDLVFHLAANSKTSHELVFEHQSTIVNGTINLLESVYQYSPASKVFITGSGLQFQNTGAPVKETDPFSAVDSYSLARIQSAYAARYYRTKGVKAYVGYLFHHDSPLRSSGHLNRKIADAALAAARGEDYLLAVGDISVEKEFGFAGDIVNGILHLVQQEDFFEACIGTGKAYTIEKWLELCFTAVGKNWRDYVQRKDGYTAAFRRLISDPSLIQASGWQPKVSIEALAASMLNPESR